MPGPNKDGIYYQGVFYPAGTEFRPVTYVNPDGSKTTRQVPVADKPLHVDYVNEADKKKLFFNPNAGGISQNAPIGANTLNTSSPQDSTVMQQQNYSKVNGFGRNNKTRRR